jgi:hypothetical protein
MQEFTEMERRVQLSFLEISFGHVRIQTVRFSSGINSSLMPTFGPTILSFLYLNGQTSMAARIYAATKTTPNGEVLVIIINKCIPTSTQNT